MFELNQLTQLLTVAAEGTLSAAAEKLHISQPALGRSMKHLEEELAVPLFERQKNRISLNENGKLAVDYARKVVDDARDMKEKLQAHERARHTLRIGSCAPAPLWDLIPRISGDFPDMTVVSEIRTPEVLEEGLEEKKYQLLILPYSLKGEGITSFKAGKENLYFTLPSAHPLARRKSLSLSDLNGETMLLRPNLGFWGDIVKKAMPDTKFLVQPADAFNELIKFSILPSFVTDLSLQRETAPQGRVMIPIDDKSVHITYYGCCPDGMARFFKGYGEYMK